jgi:RNA polymerase sigma-70 factor (ECF subfamily)
VDVETEQAVVNLYRSQFEGLFRFAMTITRDRALAEDAIQDTFLRYFIALREDHLIRNPPAWLYRVLRNRLLDDRRRSSPEAFGGDAPQLASNGDSCPEAAFRHEETSADLRASLTGRELECLQLRVEGLSYREIASTLGIRPGTVGALLARALNKSRQVLEPNGS